MPHVMIVLITYINLLNLSWIIKCLFLRTTEPLKVKFKSAYTIYMHGNTYAKRCEELYCSWDQRQTEIALESAVSCL